MTFTPLPLKNKIWQHVDLQGKAKKKKKKMKIQIWNVSQLPHMFLYITFNLQILKNVSV